MRCFFLIVFLCFFCMRTLLSQSVVSANFSSPDTVCVNTPVNILNTSVNASTYFWNFCVADVNQTPEAVNLGNIDGAFQLPVFTDQVYVNGNYYVFVTNNYPGGLVRLDFGNSMLNTPTAVSLGDINGVIPNNLEGLQVVQNEGKWYALMVAGDYPAANYIGIINSGPKLLAE